MPREISVISKNKALLIAAASIVSALAVKAYSKSIATSKMSFTHSLHPSIDKGVVKGSSSFPGGTLHCKCASDPVEITLAGNVAHNHACGCSKCWKPEGALFSIIGVIPCEQLSVTANQNKLYIVDQGATIQRHACNECGVHMFGRIENAHPFKGLDFVHTELSSQTGWQEPQFAAFISSIIEQGFPAKNTDEIREQFKALGLDTFDSLSPPLMDAIADWNYKSKL